MSFRRIAILVALALLAAACGGSTISAANCGELVDETIGLFQRLIDDVDGEFEDMSVEEFVATEGDLPSIEKFTAQAEMIDEIATELGCTQSDIGDAVKSRIGELTAESDLGRFLINAIRTGGL